MKPNFDELSRKELAIIADRQADKITEQGMLIDALKANIREKQRIIDCVVDERARVVQKVRYGSVEFSSFVIPFEIKEAV
jgi:hypothetical protein